MKKIQWNILILSALLVFGATGCDFIYRLLHKQGAEEKELVGEASPLERNPTVEDIQKLLKAYGYDPGSVDGVLGLRTRDAIERFQKEQGLEETRFVDAKTWEKLSVFRDNGLLIENEPNIKLIQELLKAAGYNPGTVDGKVGNKTKEAVLSFQTAQGLKADGKIGYNTLSKLAAFLPQGQVASETQP